MPPASFQTSSIINDYENRSGRLSISCVSGENPEPVTGLGHGNWRVTIADWPTTDGFRLSLFAPLFYTAPAHKRKYQVTRTKDQATGKDRAEGPKSAFSRGCGGRVDTVSSPLVSRWATIRPNASTVSRLSPVETPK